LIELGISRSLIDWRHALRRHRTDAAAEHRTSNAALHRSVHDPLCTIGDRHIGSVRLLRQRCLTSRSQSVPRRNRLRALPHAIGDSSLETLHELGMYLTGHYCHQRCFRYAKQHRLGGTARIEKLTCRLFGSLYVAADSLRKRR
jgi:hypothetical protein